MVSRALWSSPGSHPGRYLGGNDPDDPEPIEGNEDGCPGGWYRCAFVWSLAPYLRPVADGHYSENLRLSRCEDPLVVDAVHYFEGERARWRNWAHSVGD